MSGGYRARGEDWAEQEKWEPDDGYARCLLELRSRVELLEATQHAHLDASQLSEADREAMTEPGRVVTDQPEPSPDATDEDLNLIFMQYQDSVEARRALYDHGFYHGARAAATKADNATAATVAEIRSLLFKDAAQPEPAPDAPAAPKGLPKERLARIIEPGDLLGGLTLRDVVEWLREQLDAPETAAALEKEATQ